MAPTLDFNQWGVWVSFSKYALIWAYFCNVIKFGKKKRKKKKLIRKHFFCFIFHQSETKNSNMQ